MRLTNIAKIDFDLYGTNKEYPWILEVILPVNATTASRRYLEALAESLDISDTRYEEAEKSYKSLGQWLSRPASTIKVFNPSVYVQGSFGLGTVIRPLNDEEHYDVDAVCELKHLGKSELSQKRLKALVGYEIEEYRKSRSMVKPSHEGRRCWTLNYADGAQFHMDIVPAIPNAADVRLMLRSHGMDNRWAGTAIAITDNERPNYSQITSDWPRSNPKGYLEWFKSRMIVVLNERRSTLAKSMRASVESIPDYKIRTPLQQAIMILKRHRDVMYRNDEINCCPISIIITTLAAHAYNGEEEITEALFSILAGMEKYILRDKNQAQISNPSDPMENFADKWREHPEREEAFYKWLRQAQHDFGNAANLDNGNLISEALSPHIGSDLAKRAESRYRSNSGSLLRGVTGASLVGSTPSFGSVPRVPTKPKGFA